MDLLEELLELGSSLSVAKIKKMIDKIAYHVPGYFLSCLGMHDQLPVNYNHAQNPLSLDPKLPEP